MAWRTRVTVPVLRVLAVTSLPSHIKMELTILMPCLNEAETIETCVRKARAYIESRHLDAEVVVADNGSTDGSQALAERCGARVVAVHSRGYGAALRHGIESARGHFVIMGDADDS